MDERTRRIAENETLFREVNERVHELDRRFGVPAAFEIVCECGDDTCFERIAIGRDRYEAVRADGTTFAVVPGHEKPEVERVVDRHDTYYVVAKRSTEGARIAAERDPRAASGSARGGESSRGE